MITGTEHEYSINDTSFNALPVSDLILKDICGSIESDISFGNVILGKELQKTVIEFVPKSPSSELVPLERQLVQGITDFYDKFPTQYTLLGLGMHPTLTLDKTAVWDHNEQDIYNMYDKLFNIHQHGWLNIQALQINFSYSSENQLITNYNKIRSILPYIIAITSSSPIVEGKLTGIMDNRLMFYKENQKEIPQICNQIIPEKLHTMKDYNKSQGKIFTELRSRGAGILCKEWLNSSGLIIRFSRHCLEIKAPDEQECIHSDMAICAFVKALLRSPLSHIPQDQKDLLDLTESAIKYGTSNLKPELLQIYKTAWGHSTQEERQYLPIVQSRIENGNLAELITDRYKQNENITEILSDMSLCLKTNTSYK